MQEIDKQLKELEEAPLPKISDEEVASLVSTSTLPLLLIVKLISRILDAILSIFMHTKPNQQIPPSSSNKEIQKIHIHLISYHGKVSRPQHWFLHRHSQVKSYVWCIRCLNADMSWGLIFLEQTWINRRTTSYADNYFHHCKEKFFPRVYK